MRIASLRSMRLLKPKTRASPSAHAAGPDYCCIVKLTASRIPKGGTEHARAAMARAWSLRSDHAFVREDFAVMRHIAEAARFTPGLWMLNRIAKLWFDASVAVRFALRPPDDYVQVYSKFFDLLEAGDGDAACQLMSEYLERHDAQLVKALEGVA